MYQSRFPKALIHIGSVPPMNEKCIQFNVKLQNLAQNRNASFISAEPMLEQTSSGMRFKPNVLKESIQYKKS